MKIIYIFLITVILIRNAEQKVLLLSKSDLKKTHQDRKLNILS